MAPNDKAGRVVFIGNIPYGVTEETINETLMRVGQFVSFRLVYDKDTGRPKGFGFAEYADSDSAASAVRNLNDFELMGRKLRVDWSNDNGAGDAAPAGYAPQPVNGQDNTAQLTSASALPPFPLGSDLPSGLSCPDAISRTLSSLPAPQLLDILSQMKGLVASDPARATELLRQAPQLSYAIFQSLLLLGLVDTSILAQVVEVAANPQNAGPMPPAPPAILQPTPGQPTVFPGYPQLGQPQHAPTPPLPPNPGYPYQQPPQPPAPTPAAPSATLSRDELIRAVMNMSQQEIDSLPADHRASIQALRGQLMAGGPLPF